MMVSLAITYPEWVITEVILVNAPNKLNSKNELVRADTLDTFKQFWMDHGSNIKSDIKIAMITNQPYGT